MPHYRYRAVQTDGTIVEGQAHDVSEPAARANLETQGLCVLQLDGSQSWKDAVTCRTGSRLSLRDFLVFNQQFLALVKAGLPILRTLDILTERAINPTFQHALQEVRERVRGGSAISEAMSCQPKYFPELYRSTIQSGEHTGNLVDVLQRYIAYAKLLIEVKAKVVKALAYPVFLVLIGTGVVAFLLTFVIPTFADVYAERNAALPGPTQMLLDLINGAVTWGPWILGGLAGLGIVGYFWSKTDQGQYRVHHLLLTLPLIGSIISHNQIIRFSRTLATILAGGLPLLTALSITANAMTNKVFSQALVHATARVRDGMGLAASLKRENFLPRMTVEMIEVGEATGSLETMLEEVAEFHKSELDVHLNQLDWLEPILLLLMGFVVGGIVVIMYLPIFNLAGAL